MEIVHDWGTLGNWNESHLEIGYYTLMEENNLCEMDL